MLFYEKTSTICFFNIRIKINLVSRWQEYDDTMSDARVVITRLMMQEHTKIYPNRDAGCIPFLAFHQEVSEWQRH